MAKRNKWERERVEDEFEFEWMLIKLGKESDFEHDENWLIDFAKMIRLIF